MSHGSCCLGNAVYVICGAVFSKKEKRLKRIGSVERLDLSSAEARWESIVIPDVCGRGHLGVAPVSSTQIVILGGFSALGGKFTNKHWLFDTESHHVSEAASNKTKAIAPWQQATMQVSPGIVLTIDYKTEKLMQYSHDQ